MLRVAGVATVVGLVVVVVVVEVVVQPGSAVTTRPNNGSTLADAIARRPLQGF